MKWYPYLPSLLPQSRAGTETEMAETGGAAKVTGIRRTGNPRGGSQAGSRARKGDSWCLYGMVPQVLGLELGCTCMSRVRLPQVYHIVASSGLRWQELSEVKQCWGHLRSLTLIPLILVLLASLYMPTHWLSKTNTQCKLSDYINNTRKNKVKKKIIGKLFSVCSVNSFFISKK